VGHFTGGPKTKKKGFSKRQENAVQPKSQRARRGIREEGEEGAEVGRRLGNVKEGGNYLYRTEQSLPGHKERKR